MGKGWYGVFGYVKEIIDRGGRLFPFKIDDLVKSQNSMAK